jgi:hypothetical protein
LELAVKQQVDAQRERLLSVQYTANAALELRHANTDMAGMTYSMVLAGFAAFLSAEAGWPFCMIQLARNVVPPASRGSINQPFL